MRSLGQIDAFLEKTIGLSHEAVGPNTIAKAVELRMAELGFQAVRDYAARLMTSREEQTALVEAVVVQETWFFRNRKAFHFLADYVIGRWLKENPGRRLKVLSLPCSTGEEAYSIVMSLRDAGMQPEQFLVCGVDISEAALARARAGIYGQASFRGDDLSFRARYFDLKGTTCALRDDIKKAVRFVRGNILDDRLLVKEGPYDVIFCRNLLIYMTPQARQRTVGLLNRLLADSGILFLGHAEREIPVSFGLAGIPALGVFACRKEPRKGAPRVGQDPSPGRRFEKVGATFPPIRPATEEGPPVPPPGPGRTDQRCYNPPEQIPREPAPFNEAQRLADRGALPEALEVCRRFLDDNPTHVGAHFLMGLIHEALDSEEKAEESFRRAIYLDPGYPEALTHLAYILENRGDRAQAAHLRERAHRAIQRQNAA